MNSTVHCGPKLHKAQNLTGLALKSEKRGGALGWRRCWQISDTLVVMRGGRWPRASPEQVGPILGVERRGGSPPLVLHGGGRRVKIGDSEGAT
jgi:hypothetical protein